MVRSLVRTQTAEDTRPARQPSCGSRPAAAGAVPGGLGGRALALVRVAGTATDAHSAAQQFDSHSI